MCRLMQYGCKRSGTVHNVGISSDTVLGYLYVLCTADVETIHRATLDANITTKHRTSVYKGQHHQAIKRLVGHWQRYPTRC